MQQILNLYRNGVMLALATLWQAVCRALQSSPPRTDTHENRIHRRIKKYPAKSLKVRTAIKARLKEYTRPALKIIEADIWDTHLEGYLHGHPVVKTHLKSDFGELEFSEAVFNITGVKERVLSATDEKYLRFILTHPSGWSPTSPKHANDDWVKYLRAKYSLFELKPILDSLMYSEEIVDIPLGLKELQKPSIFLLATAESYYVYDFDPDEGSGLFIAGKSLEEVYLGLKECRYYRCQDDSWEELESSSSLKAYSDEVYFPVYCRRYRPTCDGSEIYLQEELDEFPSEFNPFEKQGEESRKAEDL